MLPLIFTHAMHRPFYIHFVRMVRRYLCTLLRYPVPSQYSHNPTSHSLRTGYLLLEYFKPSTGQMLSETWNKHREDSTRKQILFRSMARLILSLARVPQARIGSFRFHDDGTVALANRPLSCPTIVLENDGAPRIMQRSDTYMCTDAFVQPNAVYDEQDCRGQMAVKTLLRALSRHYINRERRNGPFILQLTDFHVSNIFVDQEWNITGLIDLEWICSLPVEMLAVPYWLTGRGIDQIKEEHLDEFDMVRKEFMDIFEEEEQKIAGKEHDILLTKVMCDMWVSKGVWFWYCVESVNAMYFLLETHLCPRFSGRLSLKAEEIVSQLWCENSEVIIAKKLAEKERYDQELRELFDGKAAWSG
ncbi:hypothetical protein DL98DRAFT_631697 [Cadophora sp. DSE1049]|nr:hypothetical protein DL98DRAFT_631697 [Cadophora sp. DSE1049]